MPHSFIFKGKSKRHNTFVKMLKCYLIKDFNLFYSAYVSKSEVFRQSNLLYKFSWIIPVTQFGSLVLRYMLILIFSNILDPKRSVLNFVSLSKISSRNLIFSVNVTEETEYTFHVNKNSRSQGNLWGRLGFLRRKQESRKNCFWWPSSKENPRATEQVTLLK